MHNPEQGIQESITAAPPTTAVPSQAPARESAAPAALPAPAPALAPAPAPAPAIQGYPRADRVFAFLVLVLTFFLGSFAVTNSDFWMHLATGRLIAEGNYTFGEDPFSYTTEGRPWINHNWLYDWGLYGLYQLLGGEGLVVFKALLVVALVFVVFQIRRREMGLALPVFVIALCVVAMSPRLLFQPTLVSYLFLALGLFLLFKEPGKDQSVLHLWGLPVLFFLWVNLDGLFCMGLVALGLFWLGTALQSLSGQEVRPGPKAVGVVFGVSLLACLVNPHHVQAFILPPEFAYPVVVAVDVLHLPVPEGWVAAGRTLQEIRRYAPDTFPLFSAYSSLAPSFNVASAAYWGMLLLGVASFLVASPLAIVRGGMPYGRLLLWIFFATFSVFQARMLGFLAVVSMPILVLNFQDYGRPLAATGDRTGTTKDVHQGALRLLFGRLSLGLALVALLFFAWPGWLHLRWGNWETSYRGYWQAPRRVAWRLSPDASWVQTAQALQKMHATGKLHRGFSLSPDLANYCAWECPQVKGFFDYRYALFPQAVARFGTIIQELRTEAVESVKMAASQGPREPLPELTAWKKACREWNINYLICVDFNSRQTQALVLRRWQDPDRWPLLYEDGRTFIFGYNEAGAGAPFLGLERDLQRQAFGAAAADQRPLPTPLLAQQERGWWRDYTVGFAKKPLGIDGDRLLQAEANFANEKWTVTYFAGSLTAWATSHAFLSGLVPSGSTLGTTFTPIIMSMKLNDMARNYHFPPAALVVRMRRVRQALAENPVNPICYVHLLQAVVDNDKQERFWSPDPWDLKAQYQTYRVIFGPRTQMSMREPTTLRSQIRLVQSVFAVKGLLALEPTNAPYHKEAGDLYSQRLKYYDLALEHYALAYQHVDRPSPKGLLENWNPSQERRLLKGWVAELKRGLHQTREKYDLGSAREPPEKKVHIALSMGLALPALEVLKSIHRPDKNIDIAQFRAMVYQRAIMLLNLGQVKEVHDALENLKDVFMKNHPNDPRGPIAPAGEQVRWHVLNILTSAAIGDYATADASLAVLAKFEGPNLPQKKVESLLLQQLVPNAWVAAVIQRDLAPFVQEELYLFQRGIANLGVARGVLALEAGFPDQAAKHFQQVLTLVGPQIPYPERTIAQRYQEWIDRATKRPKKK